MKVTWGAAMRRGGVRSELRAPRAQTLTSLPPVCLCLCLGLRKLMCELGNVVINQIYEARVEAMAVKKPGPSCSR